MVWLSNTKSSSKSQYNSNMSRRGTFMYVIPDFTVKKRGFYENCANKLLCERHLINERKGDGNKWKIPGIENSYSEFNNT